MNFNLSKSLSTLGATLALAMAPQLASGDQPAPAAPDPAPIPSEPVKMALGRLFTPTADLRLRFEYGDQEPLEVSHAETLRARVGAKLNEWHGVTGLIEMEGTVAADNETYRAASVDGPTDHTIIADPESVEMNQLWLGYTFSDTTIKVGRQRVILDNGRFVGNVGWRQNEQTYDAANLTSASFPDTTLSYTNLRRVNRIFGSQAKEDAGQGDFDGNSHLFNASYAGIPNAKVVAYAYLLDLENAAGNAQSNNTFGLSLSGTYPLAESFKLKFRGEYAHQTDAFDSPLDYAADYYHLFAGVAFDSFDLGVGFESIATDDGVAFRTPLATLHAFNGFADKFLSPPAGGLRDLYVSAGVELPAGFALNLSHHRFFSEDDDFGPDGYGHETDLLLVKKINEELTFLAKFAHYEAEDFATDTTRFIAELNFKF